MAYYKKYTAEFWDTEGMPYRIDIEEDTDTEPTEVVQMELSDTPIIMEYPDVDIFEPIKSGGGTLELIATEDRQFIDLFTEGYKKFRLKLYENAGTSEENLCFVGFIEPELYEQTLRLKKNYSVSVVFNNGLNVLKRERYVTDEGEFYEGIDSAYNVLRRCLLKIGLFDENSKLYWASDLVVNNYQYSNRIPLQLLIVDNANYVDEDEIAMTCYDVIDAILRPLSLSLFVHEDDVWIVDTEYLQNSSIEIKSTSFVSDENGAFVRETYAPLLDVSSLLIADDDVSFSIESSFNYYILNKNRYIADIYVEDDFSGLSDIAAVKQLTWWTLFMRNGVEYARYSLTTSGAIPNYWICRYNDVPENWRIHSVPLINKPVYLGTEFYDSVDGMGDTAAFFGGLKSVVLAYGEVVDWEEDSYNFENYLFIHNQAIPYDAKHNTPFTENFPSYDGDVFKPDFPSIYTDPATKYLDGEMLIWPSFVRPVNNIQVVASYDIEPPFVSYSDEVLLKLSFTARIVYISRYAYSGFSKYLIAQRVPTTVSSGSYWVLYTLIFRYNARGEILQYLVLDGDTVDGPNDRHPDISLGPPSYIWRNYTGSESLQDMVCKVILYDVDNYGNGVNIVNTDHEVEILINVNRPVLHASDGLTKIKVQFLNIFYEVWNLAEGDYATQTVDLSGRYANVDYPNDYHLKAKEAFRQEAPLLGLKNIQLSVVDKATTDELDKEDEEIQYSVNVGYKTEEREEEILHNTRGNIYIHDRGGFMVSSSSAILTNQDYLTQCSANGVEKDNIEDLKGDKMIRHYQKNRILLSMTLYGVSNINYHRVLTYVNDTKWFDKKWAVREIQSYDVINNKIQLTLEEL